MREHFGCSFGVFYVFILNEVDYVWHYVPVKCCAQSLNFASLEASEVAEGNFTEATHCTRRSRTRGQ